jgi:3-deoxy-D-arabino-heptulosonate 7-phosphate (DAHP) synthase
MQHSECNHAHETSNQKELINYLHAACFSPGKSTCIMAIKNGNFASWPGLTKRAVEKQGHMNQQIMNARSTEIKEKEDCDNDTRIAFDIGVTTHCIYAATLDSGKIYTDQTGRFPVVSSKGNKYIMV